MPEIPRTFAEPNLPSAPTVRANPNVFGYSAFKDLAEGFAAIDEANTESESRLRIEEARAKIEDAIKQNHENIVEPDTFHKTTTEAVKEIQRLALEGSSTGRVRQKVADALVPIGIRAQTVIDLGQKEKLVNKARGDSTTYLAAMSNRLTQTDDPVERARIENQIGEHIGTMVKTGAINQKEAANTMLQVTQQDALNRAQLRMMNTNTPLAEFEKIRKEISALPISEKLIPLLDKANSLQRQAVADAEKKLKEARELQLSSDIVDATNNRLTKAQIDERAMKFRYTADEVNKLYRAYEGGGVSNPEIEMRLERAIRQGDITDYGIISNNPNLDRAAKTRLNGLIQSAKEENHFSKQPDFQHAKEVLRNAVTAKGPLANLDDTEQRRWDLALEELWNRTANRENPVAVSRDIKERIVKEGFGISVQKPPIKPRFDNRQDAYKLYKEGKLTRQELEDEAKSWKQWEDYQGAEAKRTQERAARQNDPNRPRR